MVRPHLGGLPSIAVPAGYVLRSYRPGDEPAWAAMMNAPLGIGSGWTVERVAEKLVSQPQFEPGCLFFAVEVASGDSVATATAWRIRPEDREVGYLHMVAAMPSHRGRGLGRLVCLGVLHYMRDHGIGSAALTTDDARLPAIGTYLGLGFVPDYWEDSASDQRARWSEVFSRLADGRRKRWACPTAAS